MRANRIISTVALNPFLIDARTYWASCYYRVSCGDWQACGGVDTWFAELIFHEIKGTIRPRKDYPRATLALCRGMFQRNAGFGCSFSVMLWANGDFHIIIKGEEKVYKPLNRKDL
jgi:hypothetical protein